MIVASEDRMDRPALPQIIRYGNALLLIGVAFGLFWIPAAIVIGDLSDPALREPGGPRAAIRLHHDLAPRYGAWARDRVERARGTEVGTYDVEGTEWPPFGSVFNLTRQPAPGVEVVTGGSIPPFVYVVLAGYILVGGWFLFGAVRILRRGRRGDTWDERESRIQFTIWLGLLGASGACFSLGYPVAACLLAVLALVFPRKAHVPAA